METFASGRSVGVGRVESEIFVMLSVLASGGKRDLWYHFVFAGVFVVGHTSFGQGPTRTRALSFLEIQCHSGFGMCVHMMEG